MENGEKTIQNGEITVENGTKTMENGMKTMENGEKTMENNFSAMFTLLQSFVNPRLISCAVKYDIVDHLLEKERNSKELSTITNTHQASLRRLLTGLVEIGVLSLKANDKYSVTKFGETLKADGTCSLKNYTKILLTEQYIAVTNLEHKIETGGSGFEYAYGKPFYDFLVNNQEREYIFSEAMRELTNITYNCIAPVYDFSSFRNIVDVGGGDGTLIRCILSNNINAAGIVFDLPTIIERSGNSLRTEFGERCIPIAGDFLESVPSGGDCYIVKHVLLNFDDEKALKVLQNIRKQMKADTKLLIIEPMFGRKNSLSIDIIGLALVEGGLRHYSGYKKLLSDAGLRLNRKKVIPEFIADLIEVTLV